MCSPTRVTPPWEDRGTPRHVPKESVWSKFSSPYDPPDSYGNSQRHQTSYCGVFMSPVLRLARSLPPVSPRTPHRSVSLPRHALKSKKSSPTSWSAYSFTPPSSPTHRSASCRTCSSDERDKYQLRGRKSKHDQVRSSKRAHLRSSRSADFLGDGQLPSDEPDKQLHISKSTNELDNCRNRWIQRLDQCRIKGIASRSNQSLSFKQKNVGMDNKESSNVLSNLQCAPTKKDSPTVDLEAIRIRVARSRSVTRNHGSPRTEPKKLEKGKSVGLGEGIPGSFCLKEIHSDGAYVLSATDQPELTIRPGYGSNRMRRASSSPRTVRQRVVSTLSEPDSHSSRNISARWCQEDNQRKHPDSNSNLTQRPQDGAIKEKQKEEAQRSKDSMKKKADATSNDEELKQKDQTEEEQESNSQEFDHIPSVRELQLAKYKLLRQTDRPCTSSIFSLSPRDLSPSGSHYCSPPKYQSNNSNAVYAAVSPILTLSSMSPNSTTPMLTLTPATQDRGPGRPKNSQSVRLKNESASPRMMFLSPNLSDKQKRRLRQQWRNHRSPEMMARQHCKTKTVLGLEEGDLCHGVIFDGVTSARTGTFPASLVNPRPSQVGGMSGRGKPGAVAAGVKKVAPPTVPDTATAAHHRPHSGSSFSSGVYSNSSSSSSSSAVDQRASYTSSLSDDTNPPASPRTPPRGGVVCDHGRLGGGGGGVSTQLGNTSPSHYNNNSNNNNNNNNPQFTFPPNTHQQQQQQQQQQQMPQFAHLMCPKTSPGSPHHHQDPTPYPPYLSYQHQASLEDQGIDVQSPGRSSPGSGSGSSTTGSTASSGGCRNSTTSLDSGRASTTTHSHQHRLSGQSYDSGSILRHSYHSSSSSLGSMEHDPATPHLNVHELLANGVRDSEVLRAWLTDLRFEEYYDKFLLAGYDMPTISRMTPEDLNAIGITKPAHRKKLKAEINKLNISDGLPDFIPGRLEDWLSLLRLEEYSASLRQQKYTSVEQMTQLTWEDLEDIGITKLGHQKKVMLAIKRVKDIMAGKKFSSVGQDPRQGSSVYATHEIIIPREPCEARDQYSALPELRTFTPSTTSTTGGHYGGGEPHYGTHYGPGLQYPPQAHVLPMQQQHQNATGQFHPAGQYGPPAQGPSPPNSKPLPGPGPHLAGQSQVQYRPDVMALQVRPGSRGGHEEPIYGSYQTFHPERTPLLQGPPLSLGALPQRPFPPGQHPHPQRSMDDGDITPTNEYHTNYEGGGTLPRPRTANKLRPVAKVTAKTRADIHEVPQFIKDGMNLKKKSVEEISLKELNLKALNRQNSEKSYGSGQGSGSTTNTPQGTPKKVPPPPPRRSNSISESSKDTSSTGQQHEGQYGYLRRGLSYGYMGIKNNLQPDITPDLPPPPAPPDSANHEHLHDDFPPPPPPITCVTLAGGTRISSTITTSSMTSDSLSTSQPSTTPGGLQDDAPPAAFRPRRNDSNASFKSTSSTDSESLPFANENAGTIKQRAGRPPHPGLTALDPRSSPHASPRSSPALRRKGEVVVGPQVVPPLRQNNPPPPPTSAEPSPAHQPKSTTSSPDGTSDVLNDIGNMLANLTDELDAMLEQEVVLKN